MSENTPQPEEAVEARKPWEPLAFEKISVADAEGSFAGTGSDNAIYS